MIFYENENKITISLIIHHTIISDIVICVM